MLVATVMLVGCAAGGSFERITGQDQAEKIVWRDLFGMEDDDPPAVEWIDSCWNDNVCGFTWIGWKVQVAYRDETMPDVPTISTTRYAHELMHYATYLRTGDVDAYHWRGDWELADDTARNALALAGL